MTTDSPVRSRGQEGHGNRPGEGPHPGPRVRWRGAGVASTLLLLVLALPLGARAQTTCTESSVAVTGAVTGTPDLAGLVADCTTLLGLKDTLRGTAPLNWAEGLAMTSWDGIIDSYQTSIAGDPPRVTGLNLHDNALSGPLPAALGGLTVLTEMRLHGAAGGRGGVYREPVWVPCAPGAKGVLAASTGRERNSKDSN